MRVQMNQINNGLYIWRNCVEQLELTPYKIKHKLYRKVIFMLAVLYSLALGGDVNLFKQSIKNIQIDNQGGDVWWSLLSSYGNWANSQQIIRSPSPCDFDSHLDCYHWKTAWNQSARLIIGQGVFQPPPDNQRVILATKPSPTETTTWKITKKVLSYFPYNLRIYTYCILVYREMASPSSTPAMRQRTVAEHRWHKAWESLKKEDANEIKLDPTRTDYLDILQDIHNLATKKKEVCIQKACKYKKNNGTTVIIRDLFEKILIWVNKVKDIGDIIVSYDPGHAALPWAAVRLLLTIAVEDSHSFGVLIEGLEQISKLIAQCKVLEDLYSQSAGDDTGFDEALLELYVAILTFESHAIQIYRKSTPSRLISAI